MKKIFGCNQNNNCGQNNTDSTIKNIPVLRHLKEPAESIDNIYVRYPDGGEFGWFCLIPSIKQIAFWNREEDRWEYIEGVGQGASYANYLILQNKPKLDTEGTEAFTPGNEEIAGTIKLHRVSKTGDYLDLKDRPVLSTTDVAQSPNPNEPIEGTIYLHSVSKTGSYNDLEGRPILDTYYNTSQTPNPSEQIRNFIKLHRISKTGKYEDLIGAPDFDTLYAQVQQHIAAQAGTQPGHVKTGGDLVFAQGVGQLKESIELAGQPTLQSSPNVNDSSKRIPTTEMVQRAIDNKIGSISDFITLKGSVESVAELPVNAGNGDVYLVPDTDNPPQMLMYAWISADNQWKIIGTTAPTDLTNYLQKSDVLNDLGDSIDQPISQQAATKKLVRNEADNSSNIVIKPENFTAYDSADNKYIEFGELRSLDLYGSNVKIKTRDDGSYANAISLTTYKDGSFANALSLTSDHNEDSYSIGLQSIGTIYFSAPRISVNGKQIVSDGEITLLRTTIAMSADAGSPAVLKGAYTSIYYTGATSGTQNLYISIGSLTGSDLICRLGSGGADYKINFVNAAGTVQSSMSIPFGTSGTKVLHITKYDGYTFIGSVNDSL